MYLCNDVTSDGLKGHEIIHEVMNLWYTCTLGNPCNCCVIYAPPNCRVLSAPRGSKVALAGGEREWRCWQRASRSWNG